MTAIEAEVKKWGNSFAIIIPMSIAQRENMSENDKITVILLKDSHKALRQTFGMLKGKFTKSSQQMKNEIRKELYND